jgi:hypothetical protein
MPDFSTILTPTYTSFPDEPLHSVSESKLQLIFPGEPLHTLCSLFSRQTPT